MSTLAALLAERERRRAEQQAVAGRDLSAIAAELRSWYSEKQRHVFMPREGRPKKMATLKTRRSGATSGGVREFLARAMDTPNWRGRYVNEIREEAITLAWNADTKQGFADIIERLVKDGRLRDGNKRALAKGEADVAINHQDLKIDFANGSQIKVFAADDARSQEHGRGGAPHVLWIDESQKYPALRKFVEEIFGPSMLDAQGETWLSGTPDEWASSMFYDITRDDDLALREPGWWVVNWSVLDNPFFGATEQERFDRVIRTVILEKKPLRWEGTDDEWVASFLADPPAWFQREWQGKWVKEAIRYVYWVNRAPKQGLTYAPIRTTPNTPAWLGRCDPDGRDPSGISGWIDRWYDHVTALLDLPVVYAGTTQRIDWRFALGLDFGYNPHPFANTLWAFNDRMPDLYEMWSWKRTLVIPEWQKDCALWYWREIPSLDYLVGDPGGQAGANMEGWRQLTGIPIEDADKNAKVTWQEMLNNAIVQGLVHFREGSPLLHEMKHLTWVQKGAKLVESDDRKLNDGTVPGNDCSDGGLYSARWIITHRPPTVEPTPPPETAAWFAAKEAAMRKAVDEASARRIAEEDGCPPDWTAY